MGFWNFADPASSVTKYRNSLQQLAATLVTLPYLGNPSIPWQPGYKHAFFDVANESNYGFGDCKQYFTQGQIHSLRDGVKAGDPSRLVASSTTEGEPPANWAITKDMGTDLVAYHDPRGPYLGFPWWFMTRFRIAGYPYPPYNYVGYRQVTNDTIPIYFGEPERHRYLPVSSCNQNLYTPSAGCTNNYSAEDFLQAMIGAKESGAAAYTWHTEKLFRYLSSYSPGLTSTEEVVVRNIADRVKTTAVVWPR